MTPAAAAEPSLSAAADPTYSVGVRVGGYGFRREGASGSDAWSQCRMNGLGVFAHRALRGPLFVEAGLDGDIRIARGTYLGASLRTLVMGNFAYDLARLQMANQWVAQPTPGDVFKASPDLVEQAQFYVRRDL